MPLAESKVLGNGADADIGVAVMFSDVIHGLQHIFALISLFQAGQNPLRPLRAGGGPHPPPQGGHRPLQIPVVKGLEQEIHRPQAQGALGVCKAVVGGEDDHIGVVSLFPQLPQHLNSIHLGHLQIGDDQGRGQPLHRLQRLQAIGGLPHYHAVQSGPVHRQHDPPADHLLILHHQDFQHLSSSSQRTGRTAVTAAPPPGSFSRNSPQLSP